MFRKHFLQMKRHCKHTQYINQKVHTCSPCASRDFVSNITDYKKDCSSFPLMLCTAKQQPKPHLSTLPWSRFSWIFLSSHNWLTGITCFSICWFGRSFSTNSLPNFLLRRLTQSYRAGLSKQFWLWALSGRGRWGVMELRFLWTKPAPYVRNIMFSFPQKTAIVLTTAVGSAWERNKNNPSNQGACCWERVPYCLWLWHHVMEQGRWLPCSRRASPLR